MGRTKTFTSSLDGKPHAVRVERDGTSYRVFTDEHSAPMAVLPRSADQFVVMVGDRSFEVAVELQDGELSVLVGEERFDFVASDDPSASAGARSRSSGRTVVKAPMPGKVVKLLVAPGETVALGQALLLFEAMKMQNEIRAPAAGVIAEITVRAGDAVEARTKLLALNT